MIRKIQKLYQLLPSPVTTEARPSSAVEHCSLSQRAQFPREFILFTKVTTGHCSYGSQKTVVIHKEIKHNH
jgi:hypothetical protein